MEQRFIRKAESSLKNFMSANKDIKSALSLTTRKNAVRDIMVQQKITKDISRLSGSEKKSFIKAVMGAKGMGYETRRVFSAAFEKKPQPQKEAGTPSKSTGQLYEEIVKRNQDVPTLKVQGSYRNVSREDSKALNFSISNKGLHKAGSLFVEVKKRPHAFYDEKYAQEDNSDNIKARLKSIQG